MTPGDFYTKMCSFAADTDTEMAHAAMDDLMCLLLRELGYGAAVDVFENANKWYA